MSKTKDNKLRSLIFRYVLLILISIPNISLFYIVFKEPTIFVSQAILSLFYQTTRIENMLIVQDFSLIFIDACIAGSAYYLLTILNLSTPVRSEKQIKSLLFSLITFFVINIVRIVLIVFVLLQARQYFATLHLFLWYATSTLLVIGLWFYEIKKFNIKSIPFYTDLKYLNEIRKTN